MLYKEKDQIQIHKFLEKNFTDSEPELSSIDDPLSRCGVDMTQPAVEPSAILDREAMRYQRIALLWGVQGAFEVEPLPNLGRGEIVDPRAILALPFPSSGGGLKW